MGESVVGTAAKRLSKTLSLELFKRADARASEGAVRRITASSRLNWLSDREQSDDAVILIQGCVSYSDLLPIV